MNRMRCTFAILSLVTLASWASAQPSVNPERIDALVRKLGSASFVQREQARKELEAVGPAALDALRRASKTSDAETARRLAELIGRFEDQLLTQQILAPKVLELHIEGASVQLAIAELTKQSGYAIQFQGDATPFANKKITLTGKMPFWQAFDRLCEQGGLMEMVDLNPAPQPVLSNRIGRGLRPLPMPPQPVAAGPIRLTLRGNEKSLVSHAGSVKTEVRISRTPLYEKTKELDVTLIVSTEPSLLNSSIVGRPAFAKLVDDKGRALQPTLEAPSQAGEANTTSLALGAGPRFTQVRLKEEQAAKQIKEMVGNLSLQVDLQNVILAKMEKVMESAGKTVAGAGGGTLKVHSIKRLPGDAVEIQVTMENLIPNPFGNNIIINGGNVIIRGNVQINGGIVIGPNGVRVNGGGTKDLPDLLDTLGRKYAIASIADDGFNFVNGSSTRSARIMYQPDPGRTEPRELVLFGTRTHTIAVPFRFENLPLPESYRTTTMP